MLSGSKARIQGKRSLIFKKCHGLARGYLLTGVFRKKKNGGNMGDRLNELLEEIRELEKKVQEEIRNKEEKFQYRISKRKVIFKEEVELFQRKFSRTLSRYLMGAEILNVLSAPVIYAMIIPMVLLDIFVFFYQHICFRAYGIPRVRRSDHVVLDRHYLQYLNFMEKFNCDYCSYANGLASYISEVGARTEQYWCPIKHASGKARPHSRYHFFLDYGDAEGYHASLEALRKRFDDIQ